MFHCLLLYTNSQFSHTHTGPIVRFMTQHIALLSPPDASTSASVPITCAPCDDQQFGGFSPSEGILLCANKIPSKKYMEDTLAHEMVHLFDERRFQVDWSNLKMHACSEVCPRFCASKMWLEVISGV